MESGYRADRPLGYFQLTGIAAATRLGAVTVIPSGTSLVVMRAEAQVVRYRDDGTNPTATVGMRMPIDQEIRYTGDNPGELRFIETAVGGIVNIAFYAG
jgi:hypothetical protein